VTLASHPPDESPKSANASHLLQNMSLNRVEDFFIADVGFMRVSSAGIRRPLFPCLKAGVSSPVDFTIRPKLFLGAEALVVAGAGTAQWVKP
jgi:hypothetical protein